MAALRENRGEDGVLKLWPNYVTGEDLFGLTEPAVVRVLESLPGTVFDEIQIFLSFGRQAQDAVNVGFDCSQIRRYTNEFEEFDLANTIQIADYFLSVLSYIVHLHVSKRCWMRVRVAFSDQVLR